ncbi:(2Fe-2S)-binding protein [Streptomyces sp. MMS21 TC-5]|uniref:(2Fe-2S)-binding protein n=1 Tax=Streptomyces TaxID=1883 RepID=UPI0006AE061E|nr:MULTISPECIES: (2Fe-2S)-binding protein [unclassified Streptomyces]KOU78381.1 iron-sulfur protein [Streptomyces sp. XY593]KOU98674.1 iron-sulfur protein [Streptomyces sp. XY511]MCI4084511.1 (2Fe-2S)-binding protein [Streptomyces sp. MMS21 TC-5]
MNASALPAVAPAPPGSAVADAYARLADAYGGLRVVERAAHEPSPRGVGWVGADELAAGGPALDAFLAWDNAQVLRDYGTQARPDVVASFGLHRYAWPACLLITLPWFLDRRVPRLPVSEVAFHRTLGRMSVHVESFACLPDDPAAVLPGARVVPDEEALREEVRAAVAQHLGPVLEGFGPRMRRGRRALWGMATDEVVESLWYVGHLLGEERRTMAELEALLPGSTAPYTGGAGFRTLSGPDGRELPTRDRASCCFFYTIRPEDTCVTCPRTCDADRVTRLTADAA